MVLQQINPCVLKRIFTLSIIIVVCTFTATAAQNATPTQAANRPELAAILNITYPDVQLRRANTEAWFSLSQGAVAPFGVGDALRTDGKGRPYLEFSAAFGLILMPNSVLTILTYEETTSATVSIALQIDGHAIQKTLDANAAAAINYRLTIADATNRVLTITRPANLFAVWSAFEGTPILIVAEGVAEFHSSEANALDVMQVQAGEGAFFDMDGLQIIAFDAPYNAAHLIGQVRGCVGTVEIILNSLNVRVGPGTGYSIIGYIFDNSEVRIMGIDEAGRWYRIQQFSGFAWSDALAIRNECQNLTMLPRDSIEANYEAFEVRAFELAYLTPFYDVPVENLWFYRGVLIE